MPSFEDRRVLVTGSGRGIGKGTRSLHIQPIFRGQPMTQRPSRQRLSSNADVHSGG